MKCKEIKNYLNDYIDGQLDPEQNKIVAGHLAVCSRCKKEIDQVLAIIHETKLMPREISPERDLWEDISDRIGSSEVQDVKIFPLETAAAVKEHYTLKFNTSAFFPGRKFAAVFSVITVIAAVCLMLFLNKNKQGNFWHVEQLEGAPVVANKKIDQLGKLRQGEWVETDAISKARLKIASIGEVDIFPKSKIRLIETKPSEYRILLKKGEIDAKIMAPPKLFFVETPSATAIDLGCRYTLKVSDDGTGLLHVLFGKVMFEFDGRESVVPSDAYCETRVAAGPGTPFYKDASDKMKQALSKIDFGQWGCDDLHTVLAEAGKKDALSLWHLLRKVEPAEKLVIYKKLAGMYNIPPDINIDGINKNDEEMYRRLWNALEIGKKKS